MTTHRVVDLGAIIQIQNPEGTSALLAVYRNFGDNGEALELARRIAEFLDRTAA